MEKAQRYMGGFSGINNNNNHYENDSDGFGFVGDFVGVMIVIALIGSFFMWLGEELTDLWSKGIIQMILGALGLGGVGFLGYKLYENGTFEKIKKYFEEKEIQKTKEKSKKTNLSKTKEKTNNSSSKNQDNNSKSDTTKSSIKRLIATTTAITVLGSGYHILNTNTFNGRKISLLSCGRLEDYQYPPTYNFNKLYLLGNNINFDTFMYDIDENRDSFLSPDYYGLDYNDLDKICMININDVNKYLKNENYSFSPNYYLFETMFFNFLDCYDTYAVKMFSDYRNGIIYYASCNKKEELQKLVIDFIKTCDLFINTDNTYQLGNPIIQWSYKYRDLSPLAKMIILNICDAIFQIDMGYLDDCLVYYDETRDIYKKAYLRYVRKNVDYMLDYLKKENRNRQYIKYPTIYD